MTLSVSASHYLFPTKVLLSYDSQFTAYQSELIEWLNTYSQDNPGVSRSNCNGYQSSDKFYLAKSFTPFFDKISTHIKYTIKEYLSEQSPPAGLSLELGGMWFNYNYQHSYNNSHTHPSSVLAGVLWVQCPTNGGSLIIEDPLAFGSSCITTKTFKDYAPIPGRIALFPAHIPHRVEMNSSKTPRISISFNLYQP